MPKAAPTPCRQPGCRALVDKPGYCEQHKKNRATAKKTIDKQRGTAAQRGYGYRWQKARAVFLQSNPLCVSCKRNGRLIEATVVDHIKPHRGDMAVFWDQANWQPLCKPCHDRKTAIEDSGFAGGVR